jgi:DNA-binding response OmpR family regulator
MAERELALLYVEDDATIRTISVLALEDAGYVVVESADGRSALEILAAGASSFCAVITDINLGTGPTGWDVAKRARDLSETIPIIYVTGAAGADWKVEGVRDSIMISKPFTPDQLIAAIDRVRRE